MFDVLYIFRSGNDGYWIQGFHLDFEISSPRDSFRKKYGLHNV